MTDAGTSAGEAAIKLSGIRVWTPEGVEILRGVDWTVCRGEHWALLGPNGSGKSTLLSVAGAWRHPSAGSASVLGSEFGRTDMPALRTRIGIVNPAQKVLGWLNVEEVALTGVTATVRPLWDRYGERERERARAVLDLVGCAALAAQPISTCSQGELQRVRIARALMTAPDLLLLDEPAVGLDLPAREALIGAIVELVRADPRLTTVVVTHHLEELPPSTTHALLLRSGEAVAAGPIHEVLTDEAVSDCFGFPVAIESVKGRWFARAAGSWRRAGAPRETAWSPSIPLGDDEGF